jgi:hypothetical protein
VRSLLGFSLPVNCKYSVNNRVLPEQVGRFPSPLYIEGVLTTAPQGGML